MTNQLLTPHDCQVTSLFVVGLLLTKVQHFDIKFRTILMLFVGDIPKSVMLLNHFMSSM
jgi:hypothetical protein